MTSPFVFGSNADFYYNGIVLSPFLHQADLTQSRDQAETTTFGAAAKTFLPGLRSSTMTCSGYLALDQSGPSQLGVEAQLGAALATTDVLASFFPTGAAAGAVGYSLNVISSSFQVDSDNTKAIGVSAKFEGDGALMKGEVVATGSPTSPSLVLDAGLGTIANNAICVIQVLNVTSGGTNEVQTVTINGGPTGGTFTLTLNGYTTTALAYNATAAQVQAALQALPSVGLNNVTVSLSGSVYTVTFVGNLAAQNIAAMTATASFTGGTAPSVIIATPTSGVAGSVAFQLQDSADNSTFADLAGVTATATGPGSFMLSSASVRRYVRLRWTGTGTFTAIIARGR